MLSLRDNWVIDVIRRDACLLTLVPVVKISESVLLHTEKVRVAGHVS
jgi:hypothetical protein